MNTYIFVLDDGSEIEIQAATRVCAMEDFANTYCTNGVLSVVVKEILVVNDQTGEVY